MISTGFGFWSPIIFLLFIAVIGLIVFIIRSLGEKRYSKEKDKAIIFFSGDLPPRRSVGNVYWGFFEFMKKYYEQMEKIHNGLVNDYIYWLVLLAVVILVVVVII